MEMGAKLEHASASAVPRLSLSVETIREGTMAKAKKTIDEAKQIQNPELDLVDKNVVSFEEIPGVLNMFNVTRITLSHNKLKTIPPGLANLINLEILNLFNNHIEELPISLSSLPKLRILNLGMNKLNSLPRGFGALPVLEVLDLTYNNLNEKTLPGNFFMLETLRALYLGDNDFQFIPPQIGLLKNLQILVLRENDLIELPKEIGDLQRLRELHIQANRLTILPPEIGNLDFLSSKSVLRMDFNPWVPPIADQLVIGISHVIDYIRSETYPYSAGTLLPNPLHHHKQSIKAKKFQEYGSHFFVFAGSSNFIMSYYWVPIDFHEAVFTNGHFYESKKRTPSPPRPPKMIYV